MKRFLIQTVIFILIGMALFSAHGIIRTQSLAGFPNAQRSAAVLLSSAALLSLPAAVVSTVSAVWGRLQWSTIVGSAVVPAVLYAALMTVATPDLGTILNFCMIGAVTAAVSHWLSEKILRLR